MPPGWTQEPMTSRWVSDPAAPGIFYFQTFVGVCGGQQWLERWPKPMWWNEGSDSSWQTWHPSCGGLSDNLAPNLGRVRRKPKLFPGLYIKLPFQCCSCFGGVFKNVYFLKYSVGLGDLNTSQRPARLELHNDYLSLAEIYSGLSDYNCLIAMDSL